MKGLELEWSKTHTILVKIIEKFLQYENYYFMFTKRI